MAYKRFPNTGTLFYFGAGTYTALGYFTPPTVTTIHIHCNIQPNRGTQVAGQSGDSVTYRFDVSCPKITTVFTDLQGLQFGFNGASYQVLRIHNYTKHTEFQI